MNERTYGERRGRLRRAIAAVIVTSGLILGSAVPAAATVDGEVERPRVAETPAQTKPAPQREDDRVSARAGAGVLDVAITPVTDAGDPLATAGSGTNNNHVSYRIDYSCAVAGCDAATVKLSPSQLNPWNIATSGNTNTLLRYATWTPPAGVSGAGVSGDDATGKTFALGNLAAGSAGSFTVTYAFYDLNRGPASGSLYPDGFQIVHSATISSATAAADVTKASAPVTWKTDLPNPGIVITGDGAVITPGTDMTYSIRMTDGSVTLNTGNFVGRAGRQGAGNSKVTMQVPAEAVVVSAGGGVYDPAARTITWETGTLANPVQCAAGGWGLLNAPANTWNVTPPCYAPRSVVLNYPASRFPAADSSGCNFEADVTPRVSVGVNYLDSARTAKSASAESTQTVSCYDPFGKFEVLEKWSTGTVSGTDTRNQQVPPDVTGMTCPSSGIDDWGRTCTPDRPLPPFASAFHTWHVAGYNPGNVPGTMTITDTQLDQPGMPVKSIATRGATTPSTFTYTYQCGTAAPITGTSTGTSLALTSLVGANTQGCRFTSVEVVSGSVPGGNVRPTDTGKGTEFLVSFTYEVVPGTATGMRTNSASGSLDYPDYPTLTGGSKVSNPANVNLIPLPKTTVLPVITATSPVAPVVTGGGQAVPGKEVTFTAGGTTKSFGADGTFEPQLIFFAPVGWTVKPESASMAAGAPAGVSFTYRTVTDTAGKQREMVMASWPAGVSFGVNAVLPNMSVIATPSYAVTAGSSSVANVWLGDRRNDVLKSGTAVFSSAAQDTKDFDADGSIVEWFSHATTAALTVGATSATSVLKEICKPDADEADGCEWISDPDSPVVLAPTTSAIKYRIVMQNTGNTTLNGVVGYDVLPYPGDTGTSSSTAGVPRGSTFDESLVGVTASSPGLTFSYSNSTNPPRSDVYSGATTGDWSAAESGARAIRIQYGSPLAPGKSVSFDYTARVSGAAAADKRGCNSVAGVATGMLPTEPRPVCVTLAEADLRVTGPASVTGQVGRPVSLPFVVTNLGGSATAPATVSVDVPAGVTITDLTPDGWTCTSAGSAPVVGPATLQCTPAAPLAKGVDAPLTLSGVLTAAAADVTAAASGTLSDPNLENNERTIKVVGSRPAGLELTKSDGVPSAVVGQNLTYTLTVKNGLTAEAVSDVSVTDTLPEGTQFVSASNGGTFSGGAVSWNIPKIGPSGTAKVEVTVKVLASARNSITNSAKASVKDPVFPEKSLAADATDTDTVDRMELTKTGVLANPGNPKPGDAVKYTFVLKNTGGGPISNVSIEDPKSGLSPITIGSWPSLPGHLGAGESVTGTATYTLTQADLDSGTVSNTATANADSRGGEELKDQATAEIPLASTPKLSLDKQASAGPAVPAPGDVVTYTFTVKNTGNVTVRSIDLTDQMSGLSAITYGTWPGTAGRLASGESVTATATYTLTPADVDRGLVKNTAWVTGVAPDGSSVEASGDATLSIPANAALSLEKSGAAAHPTQTTPGDTVTYTFVAKNTGNVTLTDVTVVDRLDGLSSLSYTWPGAPGVLRAGESVTATAAYVTTQADIDAGGVDNSAEVSGDAPDGQTAKAIDSTSVSLPADPALTLRKTGTIGDGTPKAGDTVSYTFEVTNSGSVTLHDVKISDAMRGLSKIESKDFDPQIGAKLAPGGSVSANATYTLTQADIDRGHVDNTALVEGLSPKDRPVQARDSATVNLVAAPGLELEKQSAPLTGVPEAGDSVEYTFTVRNSGNVTVTNIEIEDRLAGVSEIHFGAWPGPEGALAPGEAVQATANYELTQHDVDAGTVKNLAIASGDAVRGGTTVDEGSDELDLAARPALSLQKSVETAKPGTKQAGEKLMFTFLVSNTGNVTVNGIQLADALPGLTSIQYEKWPSAEGSLAPGESTTATALYTLTQHDIDNGSVFNSATVSGEGVRGGGVEAADEVSLVLPAEPAIELTKTGSVEDPARPLAGQRATFRFTLKNTGNVTVTDLVITDRLEGLSKISFGEWPGAEGALAPGESVTATASSAIAQADIDAGHLDNAATATGAPVRSGTAVSAEAETSVPLASVPGVALTKRAKLIDDNGDGRASRGEKLRYSFEVRNVGNVTLRDLRVDDPMVLGIPDVSRLAPGERTVVTAQDYVITEADAKTGKIVNIASVSATAPDGSRLTSEESSATTPVAPDSRGPKEQPSLPITGGSAMLAGGAVGGAALVAAGVLMIALKRRGKRRFAA